MGNSLCREGPQDKSKFDDNNNHQNQINNEKIVEKPDIDDFNRPADHQNQKSPDSDADKHLSLLEKSQIPDKIQDSNININSTKQYLLQPIKKHLDQNEPFKKQLEMESILNYKFGEDFYEGPMNEMNKPNGYGKMYKNNGSALFVGKFQNGRAQGPGYYILQDGSHYQGQMQNNKAHDKDGLYKSQDFEYRGGFQNNLFQGLGLLKSKTHTFQGLFSQGKRKNGKIVWQDKGQKYCYQGAFDDHEKFTGKGQFQCPNGKYIGDYTNGQKQGEGIFQYKSGSKYLGRYQRNKKNGQGCLQNNKGEIVFKGQFSNDMPNGQGTTYENGNEVKVKWIDGVDSRSIKPEFQVS